MKEYVTGMSELYTQASQWSSGEIQKKYRQKRSENTEKYRKNTEKRDEIQNFLRPEKFGSEAEPREFFRILVLKPQE